MRNLMVYHHLGLGDHIICNGLVRRLFSDLRPDRIFVPAKRRNYYTVASMYLDEPHICIVPVEGDADVPGLIQREICDELIQVGFSKTRLEDFDVSFYDCVGIPFEARWTDCRVARDAERESGLEEALRIGRDEDFILVHDTGSVGRFVLNIDSSRRVVHMPPVPITNCMLDWCSIAEKAQEVHCIDSSFIHLAQSLNVKRGFFHDVRPAVTKFSLRKEWTVVHYDKSDASRYDKTIKERGSRRFFRQLKNCVNFPLGR